MQHQELFVNYCNTIKSNINEADHHIVKQWIDNGEVFYFIDVRDKDEFDQGALPNAVHISKGWLEAKIPHLVNDLEAKIVLYCGGGNRSAIAAYNLQQMGYSHVYSMIGGYKGWVKAGLS